MAGMAYVVSSIRKTLPFILEWGKTKNVPQDKDLLNDKKIEEVTLDTTKKLMFKEVFKLEKTNDVIQLENSRLKFIEDKQHQLGFSYK